MEYAYLGMLDGHPPQSRQEVQAWADHDLSWFPSQVRGLGDGFARLLASATPETLAAALNVPWFTFDLTAREGLRQVLTHSAEHRSQVLSWLSTRGVDTPTRLRPDAARGENRGFLMAWQSTIIKNS